MVNTSVKDFFGLIENHTRNEPVDKRGQTAQHRMDFVFSLIGSSILFEHSIYHMQLVVEHKCNVLILKIVLMTTVLVYK